MDTNGDGTQCDDINECQQGIDNCSQLGEIQAHRSQINAITTNSSVIFTASE